MELILSGCSVTHVPKDGKKKKHELKIVHQGADPLVLAVQSKEQAEEWLKVTGRAVMWRHCRRGFLNQMGLLAASTVLALGRSEALP